MMDKMLHVSCVAIHVLLAVLQQFVSPAQPVYIGHFIHPNAHVMQDTMMMKSILLVFNVAILALLAKTQTIVLRVQAHLSEP